MKKPSIFISLSIIFIMISADSAGQADPVFEKQLLYEAGTGGYYNFRIPSMVATKEGSLLAFAAARRGKGGDWDPIDIVMRRSTDNGLSYAPLRTVVSGGELTCDNAMPITDYRTGEIHLLYQRDYRQCFYIVSGDDGLSWSGPIEITGVINEFKNIYPWLVLAPGPGHGIQMSNGRLVVPFWLSDGSAHPPTMRRGRIVYAHRPSIVVTIYSDDHGKTWKPGEVAVPDNDISVIPNETSIIQLADGRVMLNTRNESLNYRRLITYSHDGAEGWSTPEFHDAFFEPICFGSMVRYSMQPFQSKNRILFCNPDSRHNPWVREKPSTPRSAGNRKRENLTVRMSYDEGNTWPVKKVLDPEIAGYSDMAVSPDGFIHVLYEGGVVRGEGDNHYLSAHMSVLRFNLAWLTGGKDSLDNKDKPLNKH